MLTTTISVPAWCEHGRTFTATVMEKFWADHDADEEGNLAYAAYRGVFLPLAPTTGGYYDPEIEAAYWATKPQVDEMRKIMEGK